MIQLKKRSVVSCPKTEIRVKVSNGKSEIP